MSTTIPLTVTGRAVLQDAFDAMQGSPARGLIERICDSDDVLLEAGQPGRIDIVLDVDRRQLSVRNDGPGFQNMTHKLTTLGYRDEAFLAGHVRRGSRGRGSKDLIALGEVTFTTIRGSEYERLTLIPDGPQPVALVETPRPVTDEDRQALGLGGDGTLTTIRLTDRVPLPGFGALFQQLSDHYELRHICTDPRRTVTLLQTVRGRVIRRRRLAHVPPTGEQVLQRSVQIPLLGEVTVHRAPRQGARPPRRWQPGT